MTIITISVDIFYCFIYLFFQDIRICVVLLLLKDQNKSTIRNDLLNSLKLTNNKSRVKEYVN